jgi:hypothetical protein
MKGLILLYYIKTIKSIPPIWTIYKSYFSHEEKYYIHLIKGLQSTQTDHLNLSFLSVNTKKQNKETGSMAPL